MAGSLVVCSSGSSQNSLANSLQNSLPKSRYILFNTTNINKLKEITIQFARYGIEVVSTLTISPLIIYQSVPYDKFHFATISEQTILVKDADNTVIDINMINSLENNLLPVVHKSTINYIVFTNNKCKLGSIKQKVKGHLDFTKKSLNTDVFGFDDVFVVTRLFSTYYELKKDNIKICARDHCIAKFIKKFLYRTTLGDWKYNPQKHTLPIEFRRDPFEIFLDNKYINNPVANRYGIINMLRHVANTGFFFRASKNRRQNLYWYPGLNAGVPYVMKPKDPIHELIFFIHDMVHQTIPDLIFTGYNSLDNNPDNPNNNTINQVIKFVYIAYRLMSEATTLVSADMYFASSLLEAGFKYDTIQERKIYPLFESMNVDISDPTMFSTILKASMTFCLLGDPSGFETLGPDPKTLEEFVSKYEKFFIQDYRWTRHNIDDMGSRHETYKLWWDRVKMWSPKYDESIHTQHKMYSVTDFIELMPNITKFIETKDYRSACNEIYNKILELYILPAFTNPNVLDPLELRFDRMFRRYMMGQAYIFFRYSYSSSSLLKYNTTLYFDAIDKLMTTNKVISCTQAECIRQFYVTYLEELKSLSIITTDDLETYKWIYPLFKPMILSYDIDIQESHKAFAQRILDDN
jgi:inosine/xanthosine triphosphate pyrophosphatase family protein